MENLELEDWKLVLAKELLVALKRKFGKGDNKLAKVTELKQVKQDSQIINKFIQIFKWVVRDNRYEDQILVKEFKREINRAIRYKLMKTEYFPKDIKQ